MEVIEMQIAEWVLDGRGKATQIVWPDGSKTPIPFWVEYGLSDFENEERYAEFLNGMVERYEEERGLTVDVNEPVPSMFPNDDIYQSRKRMWEMERVQEKIIEKHKPAPPQPFGGVPPDENRAKRIGLYQEIENWESKLKEAQDRGDLNAADRAKNFLKFLKKDVEAIPESMFQTQIREAVEYGMADTVAILFDPKADKSDPIWKTERMQHDALLAINDFNQKVPGTTVILPKETARGTRKYKPIKPGNVIRVELPSEEKKKEFLYHVYNLGGDPHDELANMGFGPVLEDKDEKLTLAELAETPEKMSQSQYEIWVASEKKKVFKDEVLKKLNRHQLEVLKSSGGEKLPEGVDFQEEEPEQETPTMEEWNESLRPVE
jgi:hypothetical protein